MRTAIRKMGNSSGVIIPKPLLTEIGAKVGDSVDMAVEGGRVIIAPVKKRAREGWAEASKRLAVEGDDQLVWPEFANEGDDKLVW